MKIEGYVSSLSALEHIEQPAQVFTDIGIKIGTVSYQVWQASYYERNEKKWRIQYNFYVNNGQVWDETDWRICEVKNERTKSILLGTITLSDDDFPIKYPLTLDNGSTLNAPSIEK